jgi:ATP-dependent protease HslVU (ClpYQ) ATPase subunit
MTRFEKIPRVHTDMREKMMEKKPLIIITGPTAVGKTELSILLAKNRRRDNISRFNAGI